MPGMVDHSVFEVFVPFENQPAISKLDMQLVGVPPGNQFKWEIKGVPVIGYKE